MFVHCEPQLYRFDIFIEKMLGKKVGERKQNKLLTISSCCAECDNRTRRGDGRLQGRSSWSSDHQERARWIKGGRQRTQHTRTLLGGYETPVPGNADGTRLPVENQRNEVCFPLHLSSPAPYLHTRHTTETEPLRSGQAPAGRWAARLCPEQQLS